MELLFEWFIEPLNYRFMQRALLASILVGVICGTIGCYIILRRMAFIGDALSHAVLPGVVIGFMIAGKGNITLFIGAVISGLLTALLIGFVNRNSRIKEDTAIGVIFIGFFALGVLLISRLRAVHLDLQHFLFGDPLGVSTADLYMSAVIGVLVLLFILLFYKQLLLTSFDPTMAMAIGMPTGLIHYLLMGVLSMTIVASLQAVGIILVVAMLITPGATAYLITDRMNKMLILSAFFGALSAILGLYISYWLNYSSGSAMVLVATAIFLGVLIFSPRRGILIREIWQRRAQNRILQDDILKAIFHDRELERFPDHAELAGELGIRKEKVSSEITKLVHSGFLEEKGEFYELTEEGRKRVYKLLRRHRLWETYLTEKAGVPWQHVHDEAEELEHKLPDELVDEIDQKLEYPQADPHGAPIPSKDGELATPRDISLSELITGDRGVVKRVSDHLPELLAELWKKGIVPNTTFHIIGKDEHNIELSFNGHQESISLNFATKIRVEKE